MEDLVLQGFKDVYMQETYPIQVENNLNKMANLRAAKSGLDVSSMLEILKHEFETLGPLVFSFDSGTTPAVKQMRQQLLMANAGAINLEMDEMGSNLLGNAEVLATFLELYDVGKVKQKLTKNTSENRRGQQLDGRTPANMMLYGTPSKLLNGGKTEEEFISMLDTGYARRCLFGYSRKVNKLGTPTPEEAYKQLTDTSIDQDLDALSAMMEKLADPINFNLSIDVSKQISIDLLRYKLDCEERAEQMRDFEELQKAELSHRYYKALKLAGAYAFIDSSPSMQSYHLEAAIRLVEDSGMAFLEILERPKAYERVARYLAEVRKEVTQVELSEDLPFYKGGNAQRRDIMSQAIAWGYRNNIIIRTSMTDNIEFFSGETLDRTDLNKLTCSYSQDITQNFESEYAPWDQLHKLTSTSGLHYTAHHFVDKYRNSDNAIPGFNLVIIDVDDGTTLNAARSLLKDYKALFATTKRHTPENNRYRIILPLSHTVKLDPTIYKQFMENVFEWLPFEVDNAGKDIARKWEAYAGDYYYQDGAMLDALLFIPDTKKQTEHHQKVMDYASLNNLERWFLLKAGSGNRSNTLIKYAYVLVDSGYDYDGVRSAVYAFNNNLKNPLPVDEIDNTILVSVMRKLTQKN